MSVYASQRSESKAEFIKVAQNLATYTLDQMKKFPKNYKHNICDRLVNLALEIHEDVTRANSVYMHKNMLEQDFLFREKYFTKARSAIFTMSSLLTIVFAYILKGNNFLGDKKKASTIFKEWARLLNHEAALLKGVVESDKARYKKYQKSPRKSNKSTEQEQEEENVEVLPEHTFDIEEEETPLEITQGNTPE